MYKWHEHLFTCHIVLLSHFLNMFILKQWGRFASLGKQCSSTTLLTRYCRQGNDRFRHLALITTRRNSHGSARMILWLVSIYHDKMKQLHGIECWTYGGVLMTICFLFVINFISDSEKLTVNLSINCINEEIA